jgi:hypothetical protein
MPSKELKKMYSEMTREEARREVKLLKEEAKLHQGEVYRIEDCLEYLNHKVI